jgi:hypothetical protein
MGLFGGSESKPVALIDIGSGSVGGAYLSHDENGLPVLHYTARIPVRPHGEEPLTFAMLRALEELGTELVSRGAPALRKGAGTSHVHETLVSVASPWQETNVRIERLEEHTPFTFTRTLMNSVIAKTATTNPDRVGSGEEIIATLLNGYETNRPFGKRVTRADIVVLSSTLPATVAESIEGIVRKWHHARHSTFTAFASCAYVVFRDLFPHEKEFIVIDIAGEATDIAFVKHGFLESVMSAPVGLHHLTKGKTTTLSPDVAAPTGVVRITRDTADTSSALRTEWLDHIHDALKAFSSEHALPRKLFMLADDNAREYLRNALNDSSLRSLWLSDEPLTIVPVTPSQFTPFVKLGSGAEGDIFLMMLALFQGRRVDRLTT